MNRRIVIPAFVIGLALCLTMIALPVQGAPGSVALQATATGTPDLCNPQPPIPGKVVSNQLFVNTKAVQGAPPVIIIQNGDLVSVLGRTANFFWLEIQTNVGLIGWAESPYITVDPLLRSKIPVVDGSVAVVQPTATPTATGEATQAATQAAPTCPTVTGTVSGSLVALKTKPDSNSKDVGVNVRADELVTVLAFNATSSWFEIKTKSGDVGWIFNAYLIVDPGARTSLHHDYTYAEMTLTPSS